MNLNSGAFCNNEVEFLRTGEIADTGMRDICRLVSGDDVVPYAHLLPLPPMTASLSLSLSLSVCL